MNKNKHNLSRTNQGLQGDNSQGKHVQAFLQQSVYSGPIPPPELIGQYKEVYEEAPKIIFDIFQKQATHRMDLEKTVVKATSRNSTLGVISGFLIGLSAIAGGTFLLYNDKSVSGFSTIIIGLTSLVAVYIYGRKSNRDERETRHKDLRNNKQQRK